MIDERAIIDPSAELASDVEVGPWSIIGPNVTIDAGTKIGPHAIVKGRSKIGKNNRIFQFAVIGEDCQDKKYAGEDTLLEIGDNNTFREFCTVHRGTEQGGGVTKIGNDNLFMVYTHIAHDCIIANNAIFSNNASLAGHVTVDDYAILGGFSGVHQFCAIGAHSFLAAGSIVIKDVPPFVSVFGVTAEPFGINTLGLKRRGFSTKSISKIREAYKILYRRGFTLQEATAELEGMLPECPELQTLLEFLPRASRGIVR